MSVESDVIAGVRKILKNNQIPLSRDTSIIANKLLDSLGIFDLIHFVETTFSIRLTEEEMHSDNFDSIGTVIALVEQKLKEQSNVKAS